MNITVEFDNRGVIRFCRQLEIGSENPEKMVGAMGAVVLADARERFAAQGPGWAPRAESEDEATSRINMVRAKAQQRAERKVRGKLWSELRRAQRKFSDAAVDRRYEIIREFERRVGGGSKEYSLVSELVEKRRSMRKGVEVERTVRVKAPDLDKMLDRLSERMDRAAVESATRLLGKLAGANKMKVSRRESVIRNMVAWSGAHNDGDTVGNGAQLPQREFLPEPKAAEVERMADRALTILMNEKG